MSDFIKSFYKIYKQSSLKIDIKEVKKELEKHYNNFYINEINFNLPDIPIKMKTEKYLPKYKNGILAQYIYFLKNKAKIGEKNK